MPPIPDKNLEQKILLAGLRLLRTRGERGLTLRAVASAAGTTTPTVYKRFRNKDSLRVALPLRVRDQLNEAIFATADLRQAARTYLLFAEDHPNEYKLLFGVWNEIFGSDRPRPGIEWVRAQLANKFGGLPEEFERSSYALWLVCHGAATLLIHPIDPHRRVEHIQQTLAICDTLLADGEIFRTSQASVRN